MRDVQSSSCSIVKEGAFAPAFEQPATDEMSLETASTTTGTHTLHINLSIFRRKSSGA